MNEEQQRIAIAEACGFINVRMWSESCIASMGVSDEGKYWGSLGVPDYLNDLNAMHEAETVMSDQQRTSYLDKLYEVCNPHSMLNDDWNLTCATAAQRAEALLKTIGKWTTNPNEL
jgi:hypothetical protein